MAEKKIVQAQGERKASSSQIKVEGNAKGMRIGAVALWIVGIVFEVLCIGFLFGKFTFMSQMTGMIVTLVLDLICVVCGSLLWKKANHIDPASKADKTKFWLQNNLGVIIACVAFIPVIIIILTKKDLDKKTKTIGSIVAVVCLAIAGLTGYDFNPVSQEDLQQLNSVDVDYYWVATGKKYHLYSDCQHLNASTQEEIICGSVGQAEEAGMDDLCKTCWKRHQKEVGATEAVESNALEALPETQEETQE